jgi:hypothetical protein
MQLAQRCGRRNIIVGQGYQDCRCGFAAFRTIRLGLTERLSINLCEATPRRRHSLKNFSKPDSGKAQPYRTEGGRAAVFSYRI